MTYSSSIQEKLAYFGLRPGLLVAITAAALFWIACALLFDSFSFGVTFDDSFYYFTIARNISEGLGPTFDGYNLTNGFHPLWLIVAVVPHLFDFSPIATVRSLLVFQIILSTASCFLLLASLKHLKYPSVNLHAWTKLTLITVLLFFLMSPGLLRVSVNGLESALLLLLVSLLLYLLLKWGEKLIVEDETKKRVFLGLLLSLLFLTRTDCALLLPTFIIWIYPYCSSLRQRIKVTLQTLALPTLTILFFFATNQLLFGSPFQVSGQVKRLEPSFLSYIAPLLIFCGATVLTRKLTKQGRFPLIRQTLSQTRWMVYHLSLIVGYYLFIQSYPRLWHFAPAILFLGFLYIVWCVDLLSQAQRSQYSVMLRSVLIIIVLLAPTFLGVSSWRSFLDPRSFSTRSTGYQAALWIAGHTDPSDVFVSWDAGLLAYFSKRRIINLDGVVNSHGYHDALRSSSTAEYLSKFPIKYLVNHDELEEEQDIKMREQAKDLLGERAENMELVQQWPFDYLGSPNNRAVQLRKYAVLLYRLEGER